MSNFIIALIVFLLMGLAIKNIIKSKNNGESNCGCNCKSCSLHCHDIHSK